MLAIGIGPQAFRATIYLLRIIDLDKAIFHRKRSFLGHVVHITGPSSGDDGITRAHCLRNGQAETFRSVKQCESICVLPPVVEFTTTESASSELRCLRRSRLRQG